MNLNKLLQDRGMSRQDLADAIDVTDDCVVKWCANRTIPSERNKQKIIQVLGCSYIDLLPECVQQEIRGVK